VGAELRVTSEPRDIFAAVLNSLESHRPAKAEHDVLDALRERFALPVERAAWPDVLASRVGVAEFLSATLEELSPFVEMLLELYAFLCHHAATSGGRSDHFAIDADDLSKRWDFDTSKLPHEHQWVASWRRLRLEELDVDWQRLSRLLLVDNGVFYGSVGDRKFVQSLIVARRDNAIAADVRDMGDRLFRELRRALRAWLARAQHEQQRVPALYLFIPTIVDLLGVSEGKGAYWIPANVERLALGEPPWRVEDVLRADVLERHADRNYGLQGAGVFCVLWGLDEDSFRSVADRLRAGENPKSLVRGDLLQHEAPGLWAQLQDELRSAMRSTGRTAEATVLDEQRLDILLLPYWKDRWFLYELWTLLQPLRVGAALGAEVVLHEVEPLPEGRSGKVWHLPTQKARRPVAALHAGGRQVSVWFQRETQRAGAETHMEPDVRITRHDRDEDLLIIECKDRRRFGPTAARRLAESYQSGSGASLVWLVNYEAATNAAAETARTDHALLGWSGGFKPHAVPAAFDRSLADALNEELRPPAASRAADDIVWVLDVSESMSNAPLPRIPALAAHLANDGDLWAWAEDVRPADAETRSAAGGGRFVRPRGAERATALVDFMANWPPGTEIAVVTDASGRSRIHQELTHPVSDPDGTLVLSGRHLRILTI
jgi:hypothetical protein